MEDMKNEALGNEIRKGMNAMGEGFKLAGRIRNAQLIAKQGYVAFKNPQAVAAFHADPEHIKWSCTCVDGEYRFTPPDDEKKELLELLDNKGEVKNTSVSPKQEKTEVDKTSTDALDTKQIVEIYKRENADLSKSTFVSITILPDNPQMCQYKLFSIDKASGQQRIVQDFTTKFDGKFATEVIPSIYYQLMSGLPVIDHEKQGMISFQSVEGGKRMALSNLTESQLNLIKSMKEFVDNQYFNLNEERGTGTRGR